MIGIDVKSQWLMLLFPGTDVKTCLDVISLSILFQMWLVNYLFFIHRTSICTDVCNAEVIFIPLFMIEFY